MSPGFCGNAASGPCSPQYCFQRPSSDFPKNLSLQTQSHSQLIAGGENLETFFHVWQSRWKSLPRTEEIELRTREKDLAPEILYRKHFNMYNPHGDYKLEHAVCFKVIGTLLILVKPEFTHSPSSSRKILGILLNKNRAFSLKKELLQTSSFKLFCGNVVLYLLPVYHYNNLLLSTL